jgi:hypothetical protein
LGRTTPSAVKHIVPLERVIGLIGAKQGALCHVVALGAIARAAARVEVGPSERVLGVPDLREEVVYLGRLGVVDRVPVTVRAVVRREREQRAYQVVA